MHGLIDVLCGKSRPTHFQGVLTVVLKLLNQVRPDIAFFGRKDYQQALVIRRMVQDLDVPVQIEVCPIVREPDGLAMSSRNRYLSPPERAQAPALRRAILTMDEAFRGGLHDRRRLISIGCGIITSAPLFRLDYLEIRDPETLDERASAQDGDLVAAAAYIGQARLIDNGLLGRE
jgi:pantoate--beta-alanine ligase